MVFAEFPATAGLEFKPGRAQSVPGATFALALMALLILGTCLSACGGGGGGSAGDRAPRALRIVISPTSATVVPGATKHFDATVLNANNSGLIWSVSDENGGDATVGTISDSGVYRAPDTVPTPDVVTIRATSREDSSKSASARVKILTVCSASDDAAVTASHASAFPSPDDANAVPVAGGTSTPALAADHKIAAQTESYDCSSIEPGGMLTLAAGTRGPLAVRNCEGTAANPIIIRNDPEGTGPTVISRANGPEGAFVLSCNDCIGVAIDGGYKWQGAPAGKTYGIKVTMTGGGAPSAFLKIGGLSRFVTIRNVEIDGAWPSLASNGIGISVNDHMVKRVDHPDRWREGILIEDTYVHDVEGEGMYIGPSFKDGDLPLRNIEVRNNLVEDIGWEGINTKSMWAGDNRVHHNVVRRTGKNGNTSKPLQYSGISNNGGTVMIYNNWVETTGTHGIHVWTSNGPKESAGMGPFDAHIWNNVVVDAGGLWQPFMSNSFGISIGAQAGCEKPIPYVYNNTIVDSRQSGIRLTDNVGAGFVRDNIVAGGSGDASIVAPRFVEVVNNLVGGVSLMEFVDPTRLNFRLGVTSPAWNRGSDLFPPTDFDDEARPKDGAPDPGAYEGAAASSTDRANAQQQ
jgi:hypothetical protein